MAKRLSDKEAAEVLRGQIVEQAKNAVEVYRQSTVLCRGAMNHEMTKLCSLVAALSMTEEGTSPSKVKECQAGSIRVAKELDRDSVKIRLSARRSFSPFAVYKRRDGNGKTYTVEVDDMCMNRIMLKDDDNHAFWVSAESFKENFVLAQ